MQDFSQRKGSYRNILFLFLIVCAVIGTFCFQYYFRLQTTIRAESSGYLQEISIRVGSNIDRIVSDNYAVLRTMASVLKTTKASSFSEVQPVVQTQKQYWNYERIMLIDENGTAYSADGQVVFLNSDNRLQQTILGQSESMSTAQMIDGKESIVFAIPLEQMRIGDKNITALAASYSPDSFSKVLAMTSFNGQAYSQIIDKSGTVITRPNQETTIKTGYNVLSSIAQSKLENGVSMDKIRRDIADDKLGQLTFTQNDTHWYMVYTPIEMEDWYLLSFVPVEAVNARSDMLLRVTLVICGLITLIFAGLLAFLFYSARRHRRKLEQIAYTDEVTGGHTIQKFYELAGEALAMPDRPQYALVYSNMAKFKVLNEQLGRAQCDAILVAFSQTVSKSLQRRECVGRQAADNFCILMEFESDAQMISRFTLWYEQAQQYVAQMKPLWSLPVTEFGVYIIDNLDLTFPQMIDRAKLALRETPRAINQRLRIAIYNDNVRKHLIREKQLEDMMDDSLRAGEFQVYLQPKYFVQEERIGGAEALARWQSASEGMIYPDEFIPLFEKNGFVVQLDLWIFEEVCRAMRRWLDQGHQPMRISVNCSRVQLKNQDFLRQYSEIANRYQIPKGYLEIELTESVVLEDVQYLTKVINDIHEAGFSCSMDDFGSGYSSLNLIQSIRVDTLKLDKIFFRAEGEDAQRRESVVGSIVAMAKALHMTTVAEGVEYRDQVEMLRRIDCDLIQGYVFARPMPMEEFEKLAFGT